MDEKLERIKEVVERGHSLTTRNATYLLEKIDQLGKEKQEIIASKEVVVNVPPLPESTVIDILQKQIESLQVQLGGNRNHL